ncbi:hypothetical protein LUZ61_017859 [Rhynchospora tenuis]|uniref:MSP domain-containing protein n=1 Tax=Rhynchospora tenuis TaxID=198213 RepID=A0AAD6ELD9_9POAL|nr:hypothetical protein LUZ61_017859 [Rhynchospora tenuis]
MTLVHQVPATRTGTNLVEERTREEVYGDVASNLAKWVLAMWRSLKLDPPRKLYFPYEPGKQVRSAVRITNVSKCHVAFKFQTNAPKSCFMRPPGAVLSPRESIIAAVFKFLEHPEKNEKPLDQRCNLKFKILSLKVKGRVEYAPKLFEEHKNQATIEQILQVVFLDPVSKKPNPNLDKVRHILAEAGVVLELPKKPPENAPNLIDSKGIIDK